MVRRCASGTVWRQDRRLLWLQRSKEHADDAQKVGGACTRSPLHLSRDGAHRSFSNILDLCIIWLIRNSRFYACKSECCGRRVFCDVHWLCSSSLMGSPMQGGSRHMGLFLPVSPFGFGYGGGGSLISILLLGFFAYTAVQIARSSFTDVDKDEGVQN